MAIINLECGSLSVRASTSGGLLLGFWKETTAGRVPLLRPAASADVDALTSSCYPLVPFGNRVRNNTFDFKGRTYHLTPNTGWDPHYLHGEGWLGQWTVDVQDTSSVQMSFVHANVDTPYAYRANQSFDLKADELQLTLSVENLGDAALPFGLGWHPYFPMTPQTTLLAPARKFWTEVEGWLPGERAEIPADLNFSGPAPLPHRWVNNGFEGWAGEAIIDWPERRMQLRLTAEPLFRHAFLFVSDTSFDPAFVRGYFCFEPMSHLANGHNMADLGDLTILQPGESLSGSIFLRPREI